LWFVEYFPVAQREIAARIVRGIVDQHEVRRSGWIFRQCGKIQIGENVAVDGDERFRAKQGQGAQHAAAGVQRLRAFVRIGDAQIPARANNERLRKLLSQVRGIDHDVANASACEGVQMPFDQAPAPGFE
jgi:hypothetical protein